MNEMEKGVPDGTRPMVLHMGIHTGMLESLGLNMYTSVGKSLVEFVANGYDSDADNVQIDIPFDAIDKARVAIRDQAKADVAAGERDKFTVLQDPLPESINIVIRDDGHGMTAAEVESKFLIINRNRRATEGQKSESGSRYVMGRKGLGKLAGFGTAEKITIRTKRVGETYATLFTMDFDEIKNKQDTREVEFIPKYEENLSPNEKGTTVTFSRLRCDAIRAREQTIRTTLVQNFAVYGEAFKIFLNGDELKEAPVDYEFMYPEDEACDGDGFATEKVSVSDVFSYPIRFRVKFRARKGDEAEAAGGRGSLPARLRGARVYCNKRLAAGPTLMNLKTGMHNFHSQSYMECIVHADELDRHDIDHIGTNRTDLKTDNEVVDALIEAVTEIMRKALYEHGKFRDKQAEKQVEEDDFSKGLIANAEELPKRIRAPAKRILRVVASHHGVKSEVYREVAPLLLKSMNAGEVLTRLIELGTDPKSLTVVTHELAELAKVEAGDALKLYRGRRSGIVALQVLQQRAQDEWGGPRFENELHALLKENPWLIEPQFSRFLTSDKPMGDVAKSLDKKLGVDTALPEDFAPEKDNKRPDLVFLLTNAGSADTVYVVELKSPNIALDNTHLEQLESYMLKIRKIIANDLNIARVHVYGYLIGSMPAHDAKSDSQQLLMDKVNRAGHKEDWEVIPLPVLLERAKQRNAEVLDVMEKEEGRLENELT